MLNPDRMKQNQLQTAMLLDAHNSPSTNFPEMEVIVKLKQRYEKNVWQVVQVLEDISFSKMPQKCFTHNNNFTLYCQNDQRPLCASCVYQNQTHKTHRIIPLSNCSQQITRDCNKLQKELTSIIDNLTGLVKHINDGIVKMEKEFPEMVWRIEDSYKKLHQFLAEREKQHINQLRYHKQKMKFQHGTFSSELNKIALFIDEKIQKYSKKADDVQVLTKRCVYEALKSSSKIISSELILEDDSEPKLNFELFNEIEEFLCLKLPKLFSKQQKKGQKIRGTLSSAKKTSKSFSQQKKNSASPLTDKKKSPHQDSFINKKDKKNSSTNLKSPLKGSTAQLKNVSPIRSQQAEKTPIKKSENRSKNKSLEKGILTEKDKVNYHSPLIRVAKWKK